MYKTSVYADTSVYGDVVDDEFSEESQAFFEQVKGGSFQLFVSPVIEEELRYAPEVVRSYYREMAALAEKIETMDEAFHLQEAYLGANIVGEKSANDALHVAYATVCRCSLLVSWNFKHIVHFDKIALYNAINVVKGYAEIRIHSPAEVIEYEEEI